MKARNLLSWTRHLCALCIAKLADINRKTFYNYHAGVYAVLDEIENEVVKTLENALRGMDFREAMSHSYLVFEKLTEIIHTIKTATYQQENAWEQYSYRKMSAAFQIPYNDVKLITTQLRAHPNIDYRYVPTEARYRPIKYRYVDFSDNSIILDKFQQLTTKEFAYATNHLSACLPDGTAEEQYSCTMVLLVIIEEMKRDGFMQDWLPARIGNIVRYTGWDYRQVEESLEILCQAHILKQLGASASYMMALSDEDYAKLDDSSYAEYHNL